jgi:hypothetical protein
MEVLSDEMQEGCFSVIIAEWLLGLLSHRFTRGIIGLLRFNLEEDDSMKTVRANHWFHL